LPQVGFQFIATIVEVDRFDLCYGFRCMRPDCYRAISLLSVTDVCCHAVVVTDLRLLSAFFALSSCTAMPAPAYFQQSCCFIAGNAALLTTL
jgi:hypothetical protein